MQINGLIGKTEEEAHAFAKERGLFPVFLHVSGKPDTYDCKLIISAKVVNNNLMLLTSDFKRKAE